MLKKRTKIIILVAMVVLLGVTGYLNIALNNRVVDAGANTITSYNYFDSYRTDRALEREEMIAEYDAILASADSSEEAKLNAENAKQALIEKMEADLALEYSIKALGYADAVVTTSTNYINVIVKSGEMTVTQANQVQKLVYDSTDYDYNQIKVIPVE